MTKKLEPGCKAITVNCLVPENNGKIVRVGQYIGEVEGFTFGARWEVDIAMKTNIKGLTTYHLPDRQLQRIDDKEETTTWEAMRDLWVPEQIRETAIDS